MPQRSTSGLRRQRSAAETVLHAEELRCLTAGLISSLENRINNLEGTITDLDHQIAFSRRQLAQAEQMLGVTFPHADALHRARANVAHLEELLATHDEAVTDPDQQAAAPAPQPDDYPRDR